MAMAPSRIVPATLHFTEQVFLALFFRLSQLFGTVILSPDQLGTVTILPILRFVLTQTIPAPLLGLQHYASVHDLINFSL